MTGTKKTEKTRQGKFCRKSEKDGNNYYSNENFMQIEEMIIKGEEETLCIERSGEQRERHYSLYALQIYLFPNFSMI